VDLSIVTTMYHSAPYIREFHDRMRTSAAAITGDFEIIFVNDGSPDSSLTEALALQAEHKNVKVVDLSRNFGHHKAVMTGLSFAQGAQVFLINCDLEEAPENLGVFHQKLISDRNCDVVFGLRRRREGSIFGRLSAGVFYGIFNRLTSIEFTSTMAFCRLMTRRYVQSLLQFREQELFLAGLWQMTGFNQVPVEIPVHFKGRTSYTLKKRIALAINAITSFSNKPLLYISYAGIVISLVSASLILYLFVKKFFFSSPILGWTSLIVSIWMVGGLLLLSIGIVGLYLSRIFIETKNRPYTIIKELYGFGPTVHNHPFQRTSHG
jgi:putative glycosyltransferase